MLPCSHCVKTIILGLCVFLLPCKMAFSNFHTDTDTGTPISFSSSNAPSANRTDRLWIHEGSYVVLDIETSGIQKNRSGTYLGNETNRIVQLAMHKINNGKYVASWNSYFNPSCDISLTAYQIHQLNSDFLAQQPTFEDKFDDVVKFLFGSSTQTMVVGHNVGTDIAVLRYEFERVLSARQSEINYQLITADTLYMSQRDAKRRQGHIINSPHKTIKKISRLSPETFAKRRKEQMKIREQRREAKEMRQYRTLKDVTNNLRKQSTKVARAERYASRVKRNALSPPNQPLPNTTERRVLATDSLFAPTVCLATYGSRENMPPSFARRLIPPREPASFKLEDLAKMHTNTPTVYEAVTVAMKAEGVNATALQVSLGVPPQRVMKAHEATSDVMMTLGVVRGLGRPNKSV